jgi:peptidoglycan/LPS O-acetylase OafA/YrhL
VIRPDAGNPGLLTNHKLTQLEAVRGFAAAYVVIHHAHLAPNSGAGRLLYFGQEAVVLFFLLSGFVIQYSVTSRTRSGIDVRTYLLHRFRRIYPLLIFALIAAYVSASIEMQRPAEVRWQSLLANMAMLQDVPGLKRGVWFEPYRGNSPLWSLSYEWWFYVLFIPLGLALARRPMRANVLAVGLGVAGFASFQLMPNQISLFAGYFIIWWMGVHLAREYRATARVSLRRQAGVLAALALCAILWCMPVLHAVINGVAIHPGIDPVLQARHFVFATLVVCLGLLWRRGALKGFAWTLGPFSMVAPVSYSLYLLHVPFLSAAEALGVTSPGVRLIVVAAVLLPTCWLLEVKLQPRINAWTDRFLGRSPGTLQLRSSSLDEQLPPARARDLERVTLLE